MNNTDFTVTVRNTEPLIKQTGKVRGSRFDALIFNLAAALVLEAAIILFLKMAGVEGYLLYTAPAPVLFLIMALIENKLSGKNRVLIIAAVSVILVILGVVFRKYSLNGFKLIMNQLYDYGELAQAYVYNRFNVGDTGLESPEMCMRITIALGSALAGAIASIPRERLRVEICTAIFIAIALVIAYFGLLPAGVATALIIGAMILLLSKGRIISALPLLVMVGIIFALIMTVNPGESVGISRVDENLRDRIALGSVQIESDEVMNQTQEFNFEDDQTLDNDVDDNNNAKTSNRVVAVSLMILIPILAIVALAIFIHKKLEKKRHEVRAGLDSADAKIATTAMFPYAMKWLRSYGIKAEEGPGLPFSELISMVEHETNASYADGFREMNNLWKKAAYSNHEVSEEERSMMKKFMNETIQMTKSKVDFKEKLKIRFKYAL